jgi:hypothetical protein
MAQHDYIISNATFPAVRTDLNNALSAIQTTNSGTSRPTGAVAGQLWLDTTSPTTPTLKYYDGADDISLATIDHSANTVNWLDSTVSITGLSSTATGTVLTLTDSASTSTVNLIIDNQKEIRFNETTANGTNYIALKAPASVASDLTFTLPATDGASGQALVTNGSGVLSFASAGLAWQSVQTTGFTAVKGNAYPCNTTSAGFTVTLPATPSAGDQVQLVDYAGTFDTNKLIIDGNGEDIEGETFNFQLTGEREGIILTYIDSTQGWIATSGINEGTDVLEPESYSVNFLVVAGGGAGGTRGGGGGGGGGYRSSNATYGGSGGGASAESSLTFIVGTVYTITVGAGGLAQNVSNQAGGSGGNSLISGTGITTITSTGGGGGGQGNGISTTPAGSSNGASGGSGGGGGGYDSVNTRTGGSGTANQGYAGGTNNLSASYYGGGGGGGAGGAGGNGSSSAGGTAGVGKASTITGSSVTRSAGTAGSGTSGGQGSAGTSNTGNAGQAGSKDDFGGHGGSGVVILRMPTANYSSTTTGSPTVGTSGTDTILTFTGSGTYTG